MMQMNTEKKLADQIASKEHNLTRIANSEFPINPKHDKAHIRRVKNATLYLEELTEVKDMLGCGLTFKLVPLSKFTQTLETADWSRVEFDGKFCKIAIFSNYPTGNHYLVAMAAVNTV